MVKINGKSLESRKRICQTCGAKLASEGKPETCPNIERNDHKGLPYAGGANLSKGEG